MTGTTLTKRTVMRTAIFSAAFAVTTAGLVGAEPGVQSARASEIEHDAAFETAFRAFDAPTQSPLLSPSEHLAAAQRFDSAPVEPEEEQAHLIGGGNASYYGPRFAGRPTASGEIFNPGGLTAAHRTLPFGTLVKVTNQRNGQSVVVRINDRGPFHGNRVIDLSKAAAQEIGMVRAGHAPVELALLD